MANIKPFADRLDSCLVFASSCGCICCGKCVRTPASYIFRLTIGVPGRLCKSACLLDRQSSVVADPIYWVVGWGVGTAGVIDMVEDRVGTAEGGADTAEDRVGTGESGVGTAEDRPDAYFEAMV